MLAAPPRLYTPAAVKAHLAATGGTVLMFLLTSRSLGQIRYDINPERVKAATPSDEVATSRTLRTTYPTGTTGADSER